MKTRYLGFIFAVLTIFVSVDSFAFTVSASPGSEFEGGDAIGLTIDIQWWEWTYVGGYAGNCAFGDSEFIIDVTKGGGATWTGSNTDVELVSAGGHLSGSQITYCESDNDFATDLSIVPLADNLAGEGDEIATVTFSATCQDQPMRAKNRNPVTLAHPCDDDVSVTILDADQTISGLAADPSPAVVFTTSTLSATASSGLSVTFGSSTESVCTVSGSTVSYLTTGTCTVTADQAGDADYDPAPQVSIDIDVIKADQTISDLVADPSTGEVDASSTLSATASSGLSVTFGSSTGSVCSVSGSTVTYLAAGTCTVTADQAGDADYDPAPQVSIDIDVIKADQTITGLAADPSPGEVDGSSTLSATASSGLPVTFGSSTGSVCSVSGSTVTYLAAGTCTVTADQAGDVDYNPAPQVSVDITVDKADQTITGLAADPSPGEVDGSSTLSATASSGLPVTFGSSTGSVCSVSGSTVTYLAAGTCTVTADQAGDANYNPAPQVSVDITVDKADQTITGLAADPSPGEVDGSSTLSATASSGLPVTFGSSTGSVCSVSGSTVTYLAAGTCTVTADQAGDADYNPAPQVSIDIGVGKADQTITGLAADPSPGEVDGSSTLSATASSGLPVTFGSSTGSVCSVSGSTVTYLAAGTCTVTADQAGDADYNPAPQVSIDIGVGKADQMITGLAASPGTGEVESSSTLSATASSGLPVTFGSSTGSVCSVSGSTVTYLAAGTCTVTADQAGDADYNPAPQVSIDIGVGKADQTITGLAASPGTGEVESSSTLSATASSGLPVTFGSSTGSVCSVSGSTVTYLAAGTCTVTADQAGDADYNPAPQVSIDIGVGKADQTITGLAASPGTGEVESSSTLSATASSGLPVTFGSSTGSVCSVSGSTVTYLAAGTCTVTADQAGDADYNPAPQVSIDIGVGKADQTITGLAASPGTGEVESSSTLSATASSGLPVTFGSSTGSVCSVSGSTVTYLAAGTCTVTADQAGDADYNPAPQVSIDIGVGKADQTITGLAASPGTGELESSSTLSATASSGLPVTFGSSTGSVCSVSGSTVTYLAAGTCTVTADQAGDANYNPAPQVSIDIVVSKADQTITGLAASPGTGELESSSTLSATASSGLPVTFGSSTGSVCSVSGSTVTYLAAGTCTVTADQAGDANYNPAPQVSIDIVVSKADQTITGLAASPSSGEVESSSTLSATASSGLPVTFGSSTGSVCSVSGSTVTYLAAGTCTVTADQAGNANYNAAPQVTLGIIVNEQVLPIASISAVTDGAEPSTDGSFTISLNEPAPEGGLMVNYSVSGTATSSSDYDDLGSSVMFASGQSSKPVIVNVIDDNEVEVPESVILELQSGSDYELGTPMMETVWISSEDVPKVSISAVVDGAEPSTNGSFTISLDQPALEGGLTVNYSVSGTATSSSDYDDLGTSVTFASGQSSKSVAVNVIDDNEVEEQESVILKLQSGSGYELGTPMMETVWISSEDVPKVSISAVTDAAEPSTNGSFTISLDQPAPEGGLTVNYSVSGTATSSSDYDDLGSSVMFASGQSSKSVVVMVIEDGEVEEQESVILELKSGSGYELGTPVMGTVWISSEDVPKVSISAATDASEPSMNGSFTISLDQPAPDAGLTVNYSVSGTATPSSDYNDLGSSVTFASGQSSKSVVVTVIEDNEVEVPESVILKLQPGSDYDLGTPVMETVWISSEDVPKVSISAVADGTEPLTDGSFTISLNQPALEGGLTVNYSVSGTATSSSDYDDLGSSVTFAPGKSSMPVTVRVIDDKEVEEQESVILAIQSGAGYELGTPVTETVWIGDDDVAVRFSLNSYTVTEDAENASIEITRNGAIENQTTVKLTTTDGSATDPDDYTKPVEDTQTFASGETTLTFLVPIVDDTDPEGDETVNLTLTVEGTEEDTATLTIQNDAVENAIQIIEESNLPPNQKEIARTVFEACPQQAPDSEFRDLCTDIIVEAVSGNSVLVPLTEITPEEATYAQTPSTDMPKTQGMNVNSRMAALRGGAEGISVQGLSVNLAGVSINSGMVNSFMNSSGQNQPGYNMANAGANTASDDDIDFGRWGVFITGRLVFGDKDQTDRTSGYDFDTAGITIGVDYRFTDTFVAGLALGYADNNIEFNRKTGSLDTDGFSYTLYGSWFPTDNFYIDGSYIMGNGDFKQHRKVDYTLTAEGVQDQHIKQTYNANYDGDQRGINLGAGYDFNRDGWVFGPVFRYESLDIDIDSYEERLTDDGGAGYDIGWAAAIDRQKYKSQIASIGFDFSKAISRSWGVIIPQATVSWAKEFKNDETMITGHYLGDAEEVEFNLITDSYKEDFFRAGVGFSAIFRNDKSAFLMVDGDFGRELLSTYYINAGFRWAF